MSESQKMFASVSGAFIAHLFLLVLVLFLPNKPSSGSSSQNGGKDGDRPREVTVVVGDLMERLERERIEKVPDPSRPKSLAFVSTDLIPPEQSAPEEARFESDRNTSAASRLRPDESLPQEKKPTLAGTSSLPNLTLTNRDYVAGPLDQTPASFAAASSAVPSAERFPSRLFSEPRQSETLSFNGTGSREQVAETLDEPGADGVMKSATKIEATREKSYAVPDAEVASPRVRELPDTKDRLVDGGGSGEGARDARGLPVGAAGSGAMAGVVTEPGEQADPPLAGSLETPETTPGEPGLPAADEALSAKGFSSEERQNVTNGSPAKEGADAVDAIGTPLGKYKKAVRDVISAKWHEYRQKNADQVTWGILKLEFSVDASGRVNDLQITKNEANAILAEFSLRAIRESDLPPMPAEVADSVGAKGLVIHYDIIIY